MTREYIDKKSSVKVRGRGLLKEMEMEKERRALYLQKHAEEEMNRRQRASALIGRSR